MSTKLTICALLGSALFSAQSYAATWGVKELHIASDAATEHFRESLGQTLFTSITGYSVDLNAQKVAAKVKITYNDSGTVKSASYFCHEHGSAIDCH